MFLLQNEDNSVLEELQEELADKETQISDIEGQIREKNTRIDTCHIQVYILFECYPYSKPLLSGPTWPSG